MRRSAINLPESGPSQRPQGAKRCRLGGRRWLLCCPRQIEWLCPDRPRNGDVLGHVEPPFLGLVFRHKGLPPADARSELDLRDAGVLPRLDERLEQGLVEIGLR